MIYDRMLDCVSWDAGYGGDKIYTEVGSEKSPGMGKLHNWIVFPSISTEIPVSILENTKLPTTYTKETLLNDLTIKYMGQKYAVGRHALILDPGISPSYSEVKFRQPEEILRFLAGLTYLLPEFDAIAIKELAVGLSLASYTKYYEELQDMYSGKNYDFEVLGTDGRMKAKHVTIAKCTALPQCQGSFFHKFFKILPSGTVGGNLESRELMQKRCGIIDIGTYTTDAIIHLGIKHIEGTEIVFGYGISEAYNIVSSQLNGMPPKQIEDAYLERINPHIINRRYAITWKQKEYKLSEIQEECERAFAIIAQKIAHLVMEKWNRPGKNQSDLLDSLLLCGGGAICTIEHFRKFVPNKVELVENPQMSNVFGWMNRQLFIQQQAGKGQMVTRS